MSVVPVDQLLTLDPVAHAFTLEEGLGAGDRVTRARGEDVWPAFSAFGDESIGVAAGGERTACQFQRPGNPGGRHAFDADAPGASVALRPGRGEISAEVHQHW